MSDDKVPFLILASREGASPFTQLVFVRAKSLAEAYALALQEENGLCQHPDIRLRGFVASAGMMAKALQLKELAQFYFEAGRAAESNPNHDTTFEEAWDEHGAEPDDS
jgi:hypothetical protein